MRRLVIPLVATTLLATAAPARAADGDGASSVYTSMTTSQCRKASQLKIDGVDYASSDVCKGFGGLIVLRQEDDLRETVSVGRTAAAAAREPAASQGFGPFNSTTPTVEWRLDRAGKPFAIIQRWSIADNDDPDPSGRPRNRQLLIVTRLPPGAVCHTAYIDVTANVDANEAARRAADHGARGFDCSKDKVVAFGAPGRAVELALGRR